MKTFDYGIGLGLYFESVDDLNDSYVTVETRDSWRDSRVLEGRMQLTAAEAIELAGVLVRAVYGEPDRDEQALQVLKHELDACGCEECP